MDKLLGAIIAVAIVTVALLAMYFGWRSRAKRGQLFILSPVTLKAPIFTTEVFYVATTDADNYLERVALPGFGFRGYGAVSVGDAGVCLTLRSGEELGIPSAAVIASAVTTTVIDKVVEKDGLVTVRWVATTASGATTALATHLRLPKLESRDLLLTALNNAHFTDTKEGIL